MSVRLSLVGLSALALAGCSTIQQAVSPQPGRISTDPAPVVASTPTAAPASPKLIVTLVIDQFSANLFNQYRSRFTGGLRTLTDRGLVYANGYQAQGITKTCPGHSTVLSGAFPTHTGIPSNEWIDPATGEETYCLAAPANAEAYPNSEHGPVGPDRLRVSLLPDWLKAVSPQSRVFAVSGKDRGAINLAGHRPDGAFWMQEDVGLTTYLEPGQTTEARVAPVAAFNAAYMDAYRAEPLPAWTYRHEQCRALAGETTVYGRVRPAAVPPENYKREDSPLLDEATLEAAIMLLESQQLGRRDVVDMLGVSLSATDKIGHSYGTQGPEMCEHLLRLDEALGVFLGKLPPETVVVLTADHGGSDSPERMAARGAQAGRYDRTLLPRLNAQLQTRFGLETAPLQDGKTGLIVAGADKRPLPQPLRDQIIEAAIPLLNAEPTISLAVPVRDVLADPMPARTAPPEGLSLRERLRLSAVADSGADILVAYGPYLTAGSRPGGAVSSHGSVWDYDRRVPILFWRPGATGQERFWQIRTVDIAPTLANLIGVEAPDTVDGLCLDLGLFQAPACPAAH